MSSSSSRWADPQPSVHAPNRWGDASRWGDPDDQPEDSDSDAEVAPLSDETELFELLVQLRIDRSLTSQNFCEICYRLKSMGHDLFAPYAMGPCTTEDELK